MSGFEIVGVVLGVIPLLVSAIGKYKTTSQRIKFFKYKEPFVAQLILSLEDQKFFIESDLYIPLRATHLDDDQINDLLSQPSSNIFKDLEIVDAVREYLGDGYLPYQRAVARCYQVLAEIASNIGGLASQSPGDLPALLKAHVPKGGQYEFTKKIKFSLQKDDLERQIRDLNEATEKLRRIRETSASKTEVTLQSTSRTNAKFTSAMGTVRNYAHQLYSAISIGYMAGCHTEHETRLFLQSRSALMERKRKQVALKKTPVAFTVAFLPSDNQLKPTVSYKADVKVLEEGMENDYASIMTGPQHTIVTINLPEKKQSPPPQKMENLCYSIKQATRGGQGLDLYLSQGGCLCYHHKHLKAGASSGTDAVTERIVSLDEILNTKIQPSQFRAIRWTLNQRMAISFNIASSIMQLHSTPWLSASFTSKTICFAHSSESNMQMKMAQYTDIPRPFIRQTFPAGLGSEECTNQVKRSMLELGIILMELWHGKTFDEYANETGLDLGNSYGSRYDAAIKWLELSMYHILPFYLDVVTRCVECTFAMSSASPDWKDITFRKSVCEYVLRPLWENCPAEFR